MAHPRLFLSPPDVGPRERELVQQAFDSNYIAPIGPQLDAFGAKFRRLCRELKHAVGLSSGTAALRPALKIMNVDPGDAVICPALTFMGGVAPVICYVVAYTPIFLDSEASSWCLDPFLLEEGFAKAKRLGLRVKAVLPADLYGQCCNIDEIRAICDHHQTPVVLDSAEAVGSTLNGRHAGTGAEAAAFSFNGNKIITTSGGGMLASNDKVLIDRARYLSTAARQPAAHYEHTEVGYNYRLSNLSAAVGLGQLERVSSKRWQSAGGSSRLIRSAWTACRSLSFAPEGARTPPQPVVDRDPRIHPDLFGVSRDDVLAALEAENIEARPLWKPMHMQPVFAEAPAVGGAFSEMLFEQGLCLALRFLNDAG